MTVEFVNEELRRDHPGVTDRQNAAACLIDLMKKSVATLPPLDVVNILTR